jgi:hypothetical protein
VSTLLQFDDDDDDNNNNNNNKHTYTLSEIQFEIEQCLIKER